MALAQRASDCGAGGNVWRHGDLSRPRLALFKDKATPHLNHDSKVVIISHDKVQQVVPTIEPTVGALLAWAQDRNQ